MQYDCGMIQYLADALSRAYLPRPYIWLELNLRTSTPLCSSLYPHLDPEKSSRQLRMTRYCKPWKLPSCAAGPTIVDKYQQITPYFNVRNKLSVHDGVIFHGQQIVVPVSLWKDIKRKLYASHLGTESCLRRAQETIFWPKMNAKLKEMIETCETCRKYETCHQKESLIPHEVPSRPWKQVGVDLFELNKKQYLITVDYYSNFWEVDCLTSTTSSAVVLKLKKHFAH